VLLRDKFRGMWNILVKAGTHDESVGAYSHLWLLLALSITWTELQNAADKQWDKAIGAASNPIELFSCL